MSSSSTSNQPDPRFDPFRYMKWGAVALSILTVISTLVFWGLGRYYHRLDWTFMNCLFMVVITLTTIGYTTSAYRFEELCVELDAPIAGKRLADANLRGQSNVLVVAAKATATHKFTYNPRADTVLEPGVVIVLLASTDDMPRLRSLFCAPGSLA